MHIRSQYAVTLCLLLVLISGCRSGYAPISSSVAADQYHLVRAGDTLYSIAFKHGLDYKQVASLNNIFSPYTIFIGQQIKLTGNKTNAAPRRQQATAKTQQKKRPAPKTTSSQPSNIIWRWPITGKVIKPFDLKGNTNKGIDIQGRLGESVLAAADGTVVYAAGGLRGYGKLVILKHDNKLLSAYGYNESILVKEGEKIKRGQAVAKIGSNGSKQKILHFEIRKNGKPENPLTYLPGR